MAGSSANWRHERRREAASRRAIKTATGMVAVEGQGVLSRNIIAAPVMSVTTDTYTSAARISQACAVMAIMLLLPCEGIQHGCQDLRDRPHKAAEANSHHTVMLVDTKSGQCRSCDPRGLP